MLKKYKDFIFESLILESNVVFSDKFKNLLKNIESPVSKGLQDLENKDLKVTNNYIDIGDDKEQISFIPDRKAQEILNPENKEKFVIYNGDGGFLVHSSTNANIFKILDYTPNEGTMHHPSPGTKGEVLSKAIGPKTGKTYLKVQFPGGVSVLNQDKIRYEDINNMPFFKNRQSIRVGRGIKGILTSGGLKFTDSEIEKFVNLYKAEWDKLNDIFRFFKLVKGDEIAYWYKYDKYEQRRDKGTLSNSCMCAVPSDFFEIYTSNQDVCELLILKSEKDENLIKGRALVWKAKIYTNDVKEIIFMDRIYTHEDADVEIFKQFAKKMGWYCKTNNNHYSLDSLITPEGNEMKIDEITVQVSKVDHSKYPYLDTLKRYSPNTGILSNKNGTLQLEETDGGPNNNDCDYCGGEGRVDCDDCSGSGEVDCDYCRGRGNYKCSDCDGDCEIECSSCKGEGEIDGSECSDCHGSGEKECEECSGDGTKECPDCNGSGETECGNCDGSGRVDCPECG
jgi:hypothetical protein